MDADDIAQALGIRGTACLFPSCLAGCRGHVKSAAVRPPSIPGGSYSAAGRFIDATDREPAYLAYGGWAGEAQRTWAFAPETE